MSREMPLFYQVHQCNDDQYDQSDLLATGDEVPCSRFVGYCSFNSIASF